jgi:hypothetical protein
MSSCEITVANSGTCTEVEVWEHDVPPGERVPVVSKDFAFGIVQLAAVAQSPNAPSCARLVRFNDGVVTDVSQSEEFRSLKSLPSGGEAKHMRRRRVPHAAAEEYAVAEAGYCSLEGFDVPIQGLLRRSARHDPYRTGTSR